LKVLLIKLRYIGDTLTLLPVVRAIKLNRPDAQVQVMIYRGTEGILAYQKEIDGLLLLDREKIKGRSFPRRIGYDFRILRDLYQGKFDAVIDFTSSDRSAFLSLASRAPLRIGTPLKNPLERLAYHRLITADPRATHIVDYQMGALSHLGFSIPEPQMAIWVPEDIVVKMSRTLPALGSKPLVMIHPGARGRLRRWPEERFAQIADRLIQSSGAGVLLMGGPGEEGTVEQVERCMRGKPEGKVLGLPLIEVAALLKRCSLFLGNDTATGHIAAGVGTPHIILFGPTFPHMWAPRGGRGISLFKSPECCGCRQVSCIKSENPCMERIGVEEVWNAAQQYL
jgi:heptosyltransferase III